MSQSTQISDAVASETALAAQLTTTGQPPEMEMHRGGRTPSRFAGIAGELEALVYGAGIFDLGYRTFLRATGKDRVRWLNGMVTQAIKSMSPGQVGYTLILNSQGRMQGDGDVSCYEDFFELETDRTQSERLLTHLRRFIIMDDVKLEELDGVTAIGIAGPRAAEVIEGLGGSVPPEGEFRAGRLAGVEATVVHGYGPVVTKFEIHVAAGQVLTLWEALKSAGAIPCGVAAVEKLRVLEGVPAYSVDFSDKHLPQEANLERALNFTKGCYIGQEIVERIRSRATVHRALRQFELTGETPRPGPGETVALRSGETAVGELTSVAAVELPGLAKVLALGLARIEALDKNETEPLRYDGGTAVVLAEPPVPRAN
jgi:folate-binding protein YgfZ